MRNDLIDTIDKLAEIGALVEALFMAASDVSVRQQSNALQTVAAIAQRQISALSDTFEAKLSEVRK